MDSILFLSGMLRLPIVSKMQYMIYIYMIQASLNFSHRSYVFLSSFHPPSCRRLWGFIGFSIPIYFFVCSRGFVASLRGSRLPSPDSSGQVHQIKRQVVLFDKIQPQDVLQGDLGDCWLMSALASHSAPPNAGFFSLDEPHVRWTG